MIREQGYIHWDGQFLDRRLPWWPITRHGLRLAFKKKLFKLVFAASLVPCFVFLAGIYIGERIDDFQNMTKLTSEVLRVNPGFFKTYFTNESLFFLMVMLMVFSGAGLIADDRKHNALQLYLARPLRKRDYFAGKAAVLGFFLLLMTVVPGLLFIVAKLVFSGSFGLVREYPWLVLSVLSFSALVTVFFALYTLALSSLSPNRRYVSLLIFGVYILSDILFGIFYGIFRSPYFSLISLKANLQQAGALIFRQKLAYAVPPAYSLIILLGLCVLAALLVSRRIKGVSVIQ